MCRDVVILQAYLDQELDAMQVSELEAHLAVCEECRRVLEELKLNNDFVDSRLEAYAGMVDASDIETQEAWRRFNGNYLPEQKKTSKFREVFRFMQRYKFAAAACTLVLALALSLSFSSVRSFAAELLTVFRVEKVQTININPQEMAKMQEAIEKGVGNVDIDNFGQIEVSGKNINETVTLEEARLAVDFTVKIPAELPGDYDGPVLYKNSENTATFTLDVDNVNRLLTSLGSSKFLPRELDNQTFTLRMPVVIGAEYTGQNGTRLFVSQARSPELLVPEGVQVYELRDALLSIPVLPESLKKQLAAINDWQHTVLIPNIEGNSQEVQVNGVQGVFMRAPGQQQDGGSALIWQKDGVVYVIAGDDLNLQQAQAIAASMR